MLTGHHIIPKQAHKNQKKAVDQQVPGKSLVIKS